MPTERLHFPAAGQSPPTLEGELRLPDSTAPVGGVVVAHPHPQRGGSMSSNVVMAICEGLAAAGIASLRFNFRGVGASEGSFGDGVAEQDDVRGALDLFAAQPDVDPNRIGLAGYSFGARASLGVVAGTPNVKALFCVAPPLREPIPASAIPCPHLILLGDRDGNAANGVDAYAANLPDPSRLRVVSGTDHFWWGFEPVLAEAAREFFSESLLRTNPRVAL
jgi:alpha/beta superfamily hydrolase